MDKYIGRLLDNRYEILEVIGTGGMAVVYKARCHRLNRLVAIKILKDDYLEDEEFRRRFHSESQAVAMLSHPNIVSIYDVSSSITADYIVMELIDGITLKQYMEKKGVLNWKETLHFAIQIAKALEHAHGRGIVHRDIKPHNVMVLKNGSVKVTDFGIARMMSKGNTLTKEALGSVHYISPEQAKGGRVDDRSDIYSLGVVIYEMMSGRPPYDGESPVAVAIQHINGGAVMPSTLNPNIPGGLEQIIMKAMAHEPDNRYASATQMLKDLDEFRKSPSMLFDYNAPTVDVFTKPHVVTPEPPVIDVPTHTPTGNGTGMENRHTGTVNGGHQTVPPVRRQPATGGSRDRRRPATRKKSSNNAATITIICCALALIIAILIFLILMITNGDSSSDAELISVPHVVGELETSLNKSDDYEWVIEKVHDDEVEEGKIISQNPVSGTEIEKGGKIVVIVSLGPSVEPQVMPELIEKDVESAKQRIDAMQLGIKFKEEKEYHDTIAADFIIRTIPAAGEELTSGQDITLIISQGKEIKSGAMPYVIGFPIDQAESILDGLKMDLAVDPKEEFSSTIDKGEVIRTEPEAGGELKSGQNVVIYYSAGPELAKMQDLVGMSADVAINVLKSDGFTNYELEPVESDEKVNTVISQSVEKYTEVDVNTKIIIQVSKGRAEVVPVTKDVVIDLGGVAKDYECKIVVMRDGATVYNETVPAGTETITIKGQQGTGTVTYHLIINDQDGVSHTEVFTDP